MRGWVLGWFSGIVADCVVAREKPKPVLMYEVSSCLSICCVPVVVVVVVMCRHTPEHSSR